MPPPIKPATIRLKPMGRTNLIRAPASAVTTTGADASAFITTTVHAPTMYFPLIVEQALMVEPTETESKETLDNFIQVMRQTDGEIDRDLSLLKDAPHDLPVTRLDEATAARKPVLRWRGEG